MKMEVSRDGTVRFDFKDGYSSVLIPLGGKNTLCLSSQVGCAMGCKFCLSGRKKFERNLTIDELKKQLNVARKYLGKNSEFLSDDISSIVFMGMGEPLFNLDAVLDFCDFVNNKYSYAYSRILVSTCGVIPGMKKIIKEYGNKVQLAVSLHSSFQDVRDKIMPGLREFPLSDLIKVCHKYNEVYRQKIMIEYLMIDGITDRDKDLKALLEIGFTKRTNFNLIRLNGSFVLDGVRMRGSKKDRIEYFREKLMKAGYKCFTRSSMGADIGAACGMLS